MARRLFLERGYAGTTLAAIAAEAGLSVETVFKGFGNKPGLVKAVFDVSIVGDDEPVPLMERDKIRRMRAEADPHRGLRMYYTSAEFYELLAIQRAGRSNDSANGWPRCPLPPSSPATDSRC